MTLRICRSCSDAKRVLLDGSPVPIVTDGRGFYVCPYCDQPPETQAKVRETLT